MESEKLSGELRHIVNRTGYSRGSTWVTETTFRKYDLSFDKPTGLKQIQYVVCPECGTQVTVTVRSSLRNSLVQAPLWLALAAVAGVLGAALMMGDNAWGIIWAGAAIWAFGGLFAAAFVCTVLRGADPSVKVPYPADREHTAELAVVRATRLGCALFLCVLAAWLALGYYWLSRGDAYRKELRKNFAAAARAAVVARV